MIFINIVKLLVDKGLITEDEAKQVSEFPPAWGTDTSAVVDTPQWAGKYIGARYVPKIMGRWSDSIAYEPLMIVQDELGNSFTSKSNVPAGTPLSNTKYWVQTGNYNAQITNFETILTEIQNDLDTETTTRINEDSLIRTSINSTNTKFTQITSSNSEFSIEKISNILIIGDSISDENIYPNNWVSWLRKILPNVDIINNSHGGDTMNLALNRLDNVPSQKFDIVIMMIGVNDIANNLPIGNADALTENTFTHDLLALNTLISNKYSPVQKVYVFENQRSKEETIKKPGLITPEVYGLCAFQICKFNGIKFIDVYNGFSLISGVRQHYIPDGIHPNDGVSENLCRYILSNIISNSSPHFTTQNEWSTNAIDILPGFENLTAKLGIFNGQLFVSINNKNAINFSAGRIKIATSNLPVNTIWNVSGNRANADSGGVVPLVSYLYKNDIFVYIDSPGEYLINLNGCVIPDFIGAYNY